MLRSGAAAPAPDSCRDLARQASPRHDRWISRPVVPGAETCPPDAQVVVPGPACGWPGRRRQPARRSIAVCTALRQAAAGASGGRYAQAGSGAQKAGRPRPAMVPGAAAPPPQQASGKWHRRAGRPLHHFPLPTPSPRHARPAPAAAARPQAAEGALMPACGHSGGRVAIGGHCHVRPAGAWFAVARPAGLAATCHQDAPPGRRPSARSPVGGHQGAAHWQSRRWPDGGHTA